MTKFLIFGGTLLATLILSLSAGYAASLQFQPGAESVSRGIGIAAAAFIGLAAVASALVYLYNQRQKEDQSNVVASTICVLVVVFTNGGLLAVLMTPNWLPAFLWALVALLGGGLVGLLAALPTADGAPVPNPAAQDPNAPLLNPAVAVAKTAQLEQRKKVVTSLSKATGQLNAIIGGGIAFNWKDVYGELKNVSAKIGSSATANPDPGYNAVIGGGVLLYFGLLGVISGILFTRIFLIKYLEDSYPQRNNDPQEQH